MMNPICPNHTLFSKKIQARSEEIRLAHGAEMAAKFRIYHDLYEERRLAKAALKSAPENGVVARVLQEYLRELNLIMSSLKCELQFLKIEL